jgi:threonine/homoserine/homoserine lactone efflux protein
MSVFSLAMSISPGPVNLMTLSSGANNGLRKTLPFVSGATIGFTLLLVLSGLGMATFVKLYPLFLDYLIYLGGAYIAYMGYKIALSSADIECLSIAPPNFFEGFLLQWLNPKAWIACASGVSAFTVEGSYETLVLFSGIYFVICYASIAWWAIVGDRASDLLKSKNYRRFFNRLMGVSLMIIALYLIANQV